MIFTLTIGDSARDCSRLISKIVECLCANCIVNGMAKRSVFPSIGYAERTPDRIGHSSAFEQLILKFLGYNHRTGWRRARGRRLGSCRRGPSPSWRAVISDLNWPFLCIRATHIEILGIQPQDWLEEGQRKAFGKLSKGAVPQLESGHSRIGLLLN